jgi:hypothetical protein
LTIPKADNINIKRADNTNVGKKVKQARHQWLTPVILATEEAEIRRIMVRRQPRQIVHKTLSQKYLTQKG